MCSFRGRRSAQPLLELLARFKETTLRCAFWNLQDGSDFAMRVAFYLAKDENLAVDRGQFTKRALQREPQLVIHVSRRRIECRLDIERRLDARAPASSHVSTRVEQDAIHPRPQRRVVSERAAAAIGAQERLLNRILRVRAVSQHVEREALHPRPI